MVAVGAAIWKWGRAITRKRVTGWVECGPFKFGAMSSHRQGDEAALLVIENKLAVISCVRYTNLKRENPYLPWVMGQAYQYGVTELLWYRDTERQGKHTARKIVFQAVAEHHPEAQQRIAEQALSGAFPDTFWYRSFMDFRQRLPEPA